MVCGSCGFENADSYKFCIKCGTALRAEPVSAAREEPARVPAEPPVTPETVDLSAPVPTAEPEPVPSAKPEALVITEPEGSEEIPTILVPIDLNAVRSGSNTIETTVNFCPQGPIPFYGKLIIELNGPPKEDPVKALLTRVFLFLEDGEFERADEYCERVLDMDPCQPMAYLGKLLAELKVAGMKQLAESSVPFEDNRYYRKCLRYGDEVLRSQLRSAAHSVLDRMSEVGQDAAPKAGNAGAANASHEKKGGPGTAGRAKLRPKKGARKALILLAVLLAAVIACIVVYHFFPDRLRSLLKLTGIIS